ncbi:hypothetical protein PILCRDRAFT_91042 [Piloderma croceum F 1598]|uniref:MYND-type domain-containing protein n=1 Tax=Piloderma croceum (strain F 1598) TaxID=765440 RepID=A0A0C3FD34_PILCF|nr:hypothetical protein PILCRDRAFT_91042 [Piloderma croceum F 1598]
MDTPETVYFSAQGARTVQGAQDAASVIHLNPLVSSDLRLISQVAGSPNFDISYLQRILSINRQFTFGRGQTLIPHCIFASHGNEHVACVTVDPNIDRFEVSVYRTARDSMDRIWMSPITDVGDALVGGAHASESGLNLCGFVSNDGKRVLVQCGDLFSTKSQFVTSDQGAHWTPLLVHNASSSSGMVPPSVGVDKQKLLTSIPREHGSIPGPGHFVSVVTNIAKISLSSLILRLVHVGKARGVSVICGAPRSEDCNGEPLGLVLGFWQVPDAYRIILSVESYFNTFSIKRSSSHGDVIHRWSIFDQSPRRVLGDQVPPTVMEISAQNYIYDQIRNQNTTVAIRNDMEMPNLRAQVCIIHITTISYPWDPRSRVAVFIIPGFPSHDSYEVVAATPAAGFENCQPFFIRILYSSGYMKERPDTLEIIQDGSHYVLRVTRPRDATKFTVLPGMPTPRVRTTNVGDHFIFEDAKQDVLLAINFTSTQHLSMITANFAACFWPHPVHRLQNNTITDFGWRGHSAYNMTKLLTWLWYTRRTTDLDARGTGTWEEYFRQHCDQVFNNKSYDDSQTFFPSTFAAASFIDYILSSTTLIDEFFRRYHLSKKLLVSNSRAISCSLPATCRARPLGLLAFMRHIALASFRLTQINPVEVLGKPHDTTQRPQRGSHVERVPAQPNEITVTIPLEGFCSYECYIHQIPTLLRGSTLFGTFHPDAHLYAFFDLAQSVFSGGDSDIQPEAKATTNSRWAKRPMSPFSCLVDEVFDLDDIELQFSILNVIWFQRLIVWKLETFGRSVYISRFVLPLLINTCLHFTLGVLTATPHQFKTIIATCAGFQALLCIYLILLKVQQALGTWLFFRSVFNYVDAIAIALSITMPILVVVGRRPPPAFFAYSMPVLWIDLLLAGWIFELAGFSFVPFFILHNQPVDGTRNPFRDFGQSLGEMITFMSNDFTSLEPWKDSMTSIRVLRPVFTIIVSVLLLNVLIALLNLKVEAAEKRSRNIWIHQMASMVVEIERGLLTKAEREDRYWFPPWFTYTISETEKRDWVAFFENNPLNLGYDTPSAPDNTTTRHLNNAGNTPVTPAPHHPPNSNGGSTDDVSTPAPTTGLLLSPKRPQPLPSPEQNTTSQQAESPLSSSSQTGGTSGHAWASGRLSGTPPTSQNCLVCSINTQKRCLGCGMAWYCSKDHSLMDWKRHKKECRWQLAKRSEQKLRGGAVVLLNGESPSVSNHAAATSTTTSTSASELNTTDLIKEKAGPETRPQ